MRGSNLKHMGILGQKHGVRRWQNEDGSLTPEGKIRYAKDRKIRTTLNESSKILGDASRLGTSEKRSKTKKKDYSHLSDKDLKDTVARLNLEEQYGRLTGDTKRVRSGADVVHEILQDASIAVGIAGTAFTIYTLLSGRGA